MYSELAPAINKIKTYSIITIILILVGSGVSYWTAERIKFYTAALMHTENVLQRTGELYSSILERETNIRGFVITKDPGYLTYYRQSIVDADHLLNDLDRLIEDNESQQENVNKLRAQIEDRVNTFENTLMVLEEHGSLEGFVDSVRIKNALVRYKEIKDLIYEINNVENKNFLTRNDGLINNINALPFIVSMISLFSITIGLMTFYSIQQYNIEHRRTNKRINDYQQRLGDQITLLDDSNKELEQFAYVASHDLQEPLRKITAFSDLLNEQYSEVLEGEGKLYLSRITASAKRMRRLITDLLDYSRSGKINPEHYRDIDLNQIVAGVSEDMEIAFEEKNAELIYSKLPIVKGVETEYRQVFQNLISNALKFSDPEKTPKITISSEMAAQDLLSEQIGVNPDLPYYHIKISDNGIGFSPEHAERIFSIFQRLHGKNEYEGTGIGLSITRKIIESYDGLIFAQSNVGEGATFHIIVPLLGQNSE